MRLWLLLPVKPFREGKARLAPVLTEVEREALCRRLFYHSLDIAIRSTCLAGIIVVSRSSEVLQMAAEAGLVSLFEEGQGLNQALTQAGNNAVERGAEAVLALPSDLPDLNITDVERLYMTACRQPGLVITPSHDGGTNAFLLRPPGAIRFAFGTDSFARHIRLAHLAGISVTRVESQSLAFDLDRPQDLRRFDLSHFLTSRVQPEFFLNHTFDQR